MKLENSFTVTPVYSFYSFHFCFGRADFISRRLSDLIRRFQNYMLSEPSFYIVKTDGYKTNKMCL